MTHSELMMAALIVAGVIAALVGLLLIQSSHLAAARARIMDLEAAYLVQKRSWEQRQIELAHVRAIRDKAHEAELFARLSLEMGLPASGEEDDTLPMVEGL